MLCRGVLQTPTPAGAFLAARGKTPPAGGGRNPRAYHSPPSTCQAV